MAKDYTKGLAGLAPMRRRAGYTQYSLAEALGVDRGRVANWENGIWPSAGWLPKLADLLCCGIDDLYEAPAIDVIVTGDGGDTSSTASGPPSPQGEGRRRAVCGSIITQGGEAAP